MSDELDIMREYVRKKIWMLSSGSPESIAMLANLRRGLGKLPEDSPDTWGILLDEFPVELYKARSEGSNAYEKSTHAALTLFAMHMQGEDSSVNGKQTFAEALGRIVNSDNNGAVKRRFDSLVTSGDIVELVTHLRSLIQIMKSSKTDTSFDYGQLAVDLYLFQNPSTSRNVCYRWSRDFYKPVTHKEEKPENKEMTE